MDKRYEEALERAKMILCNLPEGSSSARDIETIFPELHESEDDELLEFMCCHFWDLVKLQDENERMYTRCLVYIDKLKEKSEKPIIPEWGEGDERIRKNICRIVKDHMRHCAEAGIEIGDHREALQYLEKQKERRYTKEEVLEELRIDLCNNDIYRVPEWLREVLLMAKENGKKEQQHADGIEDEIVKWLKEHFYISSFDSTKIVSGFSSIGEAVDSLRNRLKSRRPQPNNNLRWRRATAGANLPESIIMPDGDDPRFGKCAVRDSYYIPVEELKNLPNDGND